jgi:hypothetical protein
MTTSCSDSSKRIVTLERDGSLVRVVGRPAYLASRMTVTELKPDHGPLGVCAVPHRRPLLRAEPGIDTRGKVHSGAAGLEPLIARLFHQEGIPFEHYTESPAPLPYPDMTRLPARGSVDTAFLHAVRAHTHLQVRYGPGVDLYDLIIQLARAYPDAVITVAVPTLAQARAVRRALHALGIHAALLTSRNRTSERARVTVATHGQLGHVEAQLHGLDLLVLPDGYAALGAVPRSYLSPTYVPLHRKVPRVIGFVPADRRPAPAERIGLVELLGPHVVDVPAHGWQKRPVEVFPVGFNGGKPAFANTAAETKRRNLWRHRGRNRMAAKLARLLASPDRTALAREFPLLGEIDYVPSPASVAVVVEGYEHAEILAAELPGWPVDSGSPGWSAKEILTFDGLRVRPLQDIDVLVRADGGTGHLPLAPTALHVASDARTYPVLVVDVWDRRHPVLRRNKRSRQRAYIANGWRPACCDDVDFALYTLFGYCKSLR